MGAAQKNDPAAATSHASNLELQVTVTASRCTFLKVIDSLQVANQSSSQKTIGFCQSCWCLQNMS